MVLNKYHYQFVPPRVLENLAKAGKDDARATIQQSKLSRTKRSSKSVTMAVFTGKAAVTAAKREVYDCKNTWTQRVEPVARSEGDPATNDSAVDEIYEHAGKIREYFKSVLGRNSIDNSGMDIIMNVHFGQNYMNAFWDGDEMTFGDGDGTIFTGFTKSLDVVAHELGHGIVQFTADLDYYSQSGALNEHFADVFGTAITQYVLGQQPKDADWLIGNEIMGPELYGEALRSMRAPGTAYDNQLMGKDPQPDHMKDYYSGPDDNRGVHINSGIPNRVFYVVAMEIGTVKASLIWYDALRKLWSTAVFKDAVEVIVDSARLLTKNNTVPLGSTQVVRSAFKEVGLG
jgi:Zn-dependent metalloprotease